ncbi:MAG: class I SAM-dependent methyltransferase [Oscillospiraceae bacterium]|nr:class I SAM-dependent methyltransferase [Oscillospiraceae bacterium]
MRAADNWEAYRVLDTSDGEKLEIWNGVTLIRPDPQVLWKTEKNQKLWQRADACYHRSSSGGGKWEFHAKLPEQWELPYQKLNLVFQIRPTGFKHTGLFPEQAVNWDFMSDFIRNAGRKIRVLNLFAYTGGATLACAQAGAEVCHVDASKGMVQWARENAGLSGLQDKPIRWIVDDCEKFTLREIRRGRRYDAIIMDPPSYGRGPGGEVWKLEHCIYDLVQNCVNVLSDNPVFFVINSYTTGLSPSVMGYILDRLLTRKFGGHVYFDEIGLPVEQSGMCLPCGSTAVWCSQDAGGLFYGK